MSLEVCVLPFLLLLMSSFNPYFVGDESGSIDPEILERKFNGFNPYFVGDESGRYRIFSRVQNY